MFSFQCPENGYIEDYEAMINGTLVEQMFTEIKGALPEDLRGNFECQKWWFLYHSFLIVFAFVDVIFVWIEWLFAVLKKVLLTNMPKENEEGAKEAFWISLSDQN